MWGIKQERMDNLLFSLRAGDTATAVNAAVDYLRLFGSADRPWKFQNIMEMAGQTCGDFFWRTLHLEWSSFDRIPHRNFARLFQLHRGAWRSEHLTPADAEAFGRLPEVVTAYRGQAAANPVGLSWSLKKQVAESFARGHRGLLNPSPIIIEAQISRADIAGFYTDRDEAEIVIFSATAAKKRKAKGTE